MTIHPCRDIIVKCLRAPSFKDVCLVLIMQCSITLRGSVCWTWLSCSCIRRWIFASCRLLSRRDHHRALISASHMCLLWLCVLTGLPLSSEWTGITTITLCAIVCTVVQLCFRSGANVLRWKWLFQCILYVFRCMSRVVRKHTFLLVLLGVL